MHKNEFADAKSFWRNHIYHITVERFQVVSSQFFVRNEIYTLWHSNYFPRAQRGSN